MNEQKDITKMNDAELGLFLGQQYETFMLIKQNIQVLVAELEKRKSKKAIEEPAIE